MSGDKGIGALPSGSGKVLPQAVEFEEGVLGAILLDPEAIAVIGDLLKPEHFYRDAHETIYRACLKLFEKIGTVDLLLVTEELNRMGELENIGGAYYITELTNRVASSAHIEEHAYIIIEKFLARELIKVSTDLIKKSYDDRSDVFDTYDASVSNLLGLYDANVKQRAATLSELAKDAIRSLKQAKDAKEKKVVPEDMVSTGYKFLDREIVGYHSNDFVLWGAKPGEGKTSFLLGGLLNLAKQGVPVALFSLEMVAGQLFNKLCCIEAEVEPKKKERGELTEEEEERYREAAEKIKGLALYIEDDSSLTPGGLRIKVLRYKKLHGVRLVGLDYVQLMSGGDGRTREEQLTDISRKIKGICNKYLVPIVSASQVKEGEGKERRTGRKMKYSGAFEQDADVIAFIYRPNQHGEKQDSEGQSTDKIAYLDVKKNRNGSLVDVEVEYLEWCMKFREKIDPMGTNVDDEGSDVPF